MNSIRSLFGGVPAPAPSLSDVTDTTIRREQDIAAKVAQLDKELQSWNAQLKKASTPSAQTRIKQQALQVLQRRRMYETQLRQLQGMTMNMENAKFAVETMRDNVNVVQALKATTTHMKRHAIEFTQVEDIMDDLQDAMQDAAEINEMISRSYGVETEVDDDVLEAELAGLDEEFASDAELIVTSGPPAYLDDTAAVVVELPSVPQAPLPA